MSFVDSFWTRDYESGFKSLFTQLHEGIVENDDFIALFTRRMEAELLYGTQLSQGYTGTSKRQSNDDYVSTIKNTFQKVNENFSKQGEYHLETANHIKLLVLEPFSQWCKEHKKRVEYSETIMNDKFKQFRNGRASVEKVQKKYFNRCRILEEFKANFSEEEINEEMKDLKFAENVEPVEEEPQTFTLDNIEYSGESIKRLLRDMLKDIEMFSHKVAILGTYHNVSRGSAITQWLLDNMPEFTIEKAEIFGRDLIANDFIRLIGTMNSKNFINSSQYYYQWKPLAFEIAGMACSDETNEGTTKQSNQFSEYLEDMKEAMGVNSIDVTDRSQLTKLIQEVDHYDNQYYTQTVELDKLRCDFEEFVMDHFTFMQKCELDRLKAIKKATFDFISSFCNKIATMKQLNDELVVLEETIHPLNDLKFLIENYATGRFQPQVILYDNYYNSNVRQTFGVDLSVKSRLDKKVVPILIQCILSHLDKVYPEIVNDDERINLWTKPIHLNTVHKLRFQLNDVFDPAKINEILLKTHPIITTNVLKLYLLELPDSIIPSSYYDVIYLLYVNYPVHDESKEDSRINGVQNVLVDLPSCNLATLDAILTHLKRLVQIIGTKDHDLAKNFQESLCKEFAPIILKAKDALLFDSNTPSEKTILSFVTDLFIHKEQIFTELRRRNTSRSSGSVSRDNSTKSAIVASKSRLESRLQNAVKTKRIASESKLLQISHSVEKSSKIPPTADTSTSSNDATEPTTPPPATPKKSVSSSLKRSTSPNKKRLSTILNEVDPQLNTSSPTDSHKQRSEFKLEEVSNIDSQSSKLQRSKPANKKRNDVVYVD
jgi:hypothetical protein